MSNPALQSQDTLLMTGTDLVPIVPDDDADLAVTARHIRCRPDGQAGTLRFVTLDGNLRNTFIAVGEVIPCGAVRVHETGTTADGLEAII